MKIRNGFVSNSSSSSFLIAFKPGEEPCVDLTFHSGVRSFLAKKDLNYKNNLLLQPFIKLKNNTLYVILSRLIEQYDYHGLDREDNKFVGTDNDIVIYKNKEEILADVENLSMVLGMALGYFSLDHYSIKINSDIEIPKFYLELFDHGYHIMYGSILDETCDDFLRVLSLGLNDVDNGILLIDNPR